MLIIQNGTLIDPEGKRTFRGDIWAEEGRIIRILEREEEGTAGEVPDGAEVIDASGMMVGPGLIDTHVHFRDPGFTYKEDIISGAQAAKKGGYTGLVLMANTRPCVDNKETLSYVLARGKETGIRISSCATVTKGMQGKELVDMESLSEAAGFTDDGKPLLSRELVEEAMRRVHALNKPISFHEENPAYIKNNGINDGKVAEALGIEGSPREAEIDLIRRDAELAIKTGAKVVIQHISTKEGVALVREAKAAGADIHAEATPHHFTLTEEAVLEKGTLAKMNPPLREEADRKAICEGLADGTIDLIATDHAPHSRDEKNRPLTEAPSGILGLETALPLAIRELIRKGYLTYPQLFERMSLAPAKLYQLPGGRLKEGEVADLVLFKDTENFRVEQFLSKSQNSPFLGEILPGVVKMTICGGVTVYRQKE